MVKNVFNYDLVLKQEKTLNYTNYTKVFRKKCEEIKKVGFKSESVNEKFPKLDKNVRKGDLSIGIRG